MSFISAKDKLFQPLPFLTLQEEKEPAHRDRKPGEKWTFDVPRNVERVAPKYVSLAETVLGLRNERLRGDL